VPIGANAEVRDGVVHLEAVVATPDGSMVLRESVVGSDPLALGESAGASLLQRGGAGILEEVYGRQTAVPQQP